MRSKMGLKARITWTVVGTLAGAWLISAAPVFAATDEELEETIQEVIAERHPTDTPEWWKSLGPSAPKVIIALYEKTSHIYRRLRLVEALSWYDDPLAVEFLKKQALDSNDDVIRNGSIRAIGTSQGSREVDFVAKFLSNEDPQTREAAALALKRMKDPKADALLQKFYEKEELPWLRDKVRNARFDAPSAPVQILKIERPEESLRPEFAGTWKGFWVFPASGESNAMRSEPTSVQLRLEPPRALFGEITLKLAASTSGSSVSKERSVILSFDKIKGKDRNISGQISGAVLKELGANGSSIGFDGELLQQGKTFVLKIQTREILGTLVIRRQPAAQ